MKVDIPSRLDCKALITAVRHGGDLAHGEELKDAARKELLKSVRSGEYAGTLTVDAVTFVQRDDEPNSQFKRFKRGALGKVASSFKGAPFLKDHDQDNLSSRGGTIVASKLERGDDGDVRFRQSIDLVKPWAMEAALDGTLDRFSISWYSDERPTCSIDGDPIFSKYLGGGDCEHLPGDKVDVKGETKRVEAVYSEGVGLETSGVSVPAVSGTGVDGIVAQLSAMRAPQGKNHMEKLSKVAVALGLDSASSVDAVVAEAGKIKLALDAEKQAHEGVKTALAELRLKTEASEKAQLAAGIDAEVERALREGKFAAVHDDKGVRVATPLELAIRSAGEAGGVAAAAQVVDSLARILPVGDRVPTGTDVPPTQASRATEAQIATWTKMGYAPDEHEELLRLAQS